MNNIGIVGSGIAGLHLGLYLREHGVKATLYTESTPDLLRSGRLLSTVALFGPTRERERALRVDHWDSHELEVSSVSVRVASEPPLAFRGELLHPWLFMDMRLYLPRLLEDFEARGGRAVVGSLGPADLPRLAAQHDLLIVATGRAGLASVFPRLPERSPYTEPQRRMVAGLFRGIRYPEPLGMCLHLVPGFGEIFENQFLSVTGPTSGILVEAVPGGPFEPVTRLPPGEDPKAFEAALLALLRDHAPDTFARIDPDAFALTRPLDVLQGAITPVARRGWVALEGGRLAMALGDAHVTHDPITGQGANAASRAAWLLGESLVAQARAGGSFDEAFCVATEQRLWEEMRPVTEWTNAFLRPPPPHAVQLLVAASEDEAIANAFINNFEAPKRQWESLASPSRTAAFLRRFAEPHAA